MKYSYKTKGTCSTQIDFELNGDIVSNVRFTGGCNGNLQGISSLTDGLTAVSYTHLTLPTICSV